MSTSKRTAPYHHGDLRRALLEAALELLETNEFSTIGLREAAREAKVSPAAPYRHFRNREALLAATAARGFEQLAAALGAVPDAPEGERLPAMGRAYLDFALAHRNLFRLMFSSEISKDDHTDLRAASRQAMEALQSAMRSKGVEGAREAAVGAWALVHGLAVLLVDDQISKDLTTKPARERLISVVTDIYGTGLRRRR